ncbi:hypothetical protein KUCAC02_029044, partial [Chaenocephalus aceratus]
EIQTCSHAEPSRQRVSCSERGHAGDRRGQADGRSGQVQLTYKPGETTDMRLHCCTINRRNCT